MQKQKIISLYGMVLLILLGFMANGQPTPITVNGPTVVCEGTKHTYDYAPTPDLFYQWSINPFGYISSVTGNQVLVYWGASGAGLLNVYGIDAVGDTIELGTVNVTILPKPEPKITSNSIVACQPLGPPVEPDTIPVFNDSGCMKVCENTTVTYTAHGASTSTFNWTVTGGSGVPSGLNTFDVTWGPAGVGSLSVTETTINGCEGTKTICLDIIESPIADFFAFPDSNTTSIHICDSTEVVFIDRSTASPGSPIVAWHWDFGDGNFSNAQGGRNMPITHLYQGPGNYTAILTVTNACGCQSSFQIDIHVDHQKALPIECPRVMCEGDTGRYSINTTCTGLNWSAMGGTVINQTGSTAEIVWDNVDANGFGYVFYDAQNCIGVCPAIFVAKVPVVLQNGTIQGPDTICPDRQYIYRLPQWPSTKFNWNETSGFATLLPSDQPNEIIVTVDAADAGNTITIECNYNNTLLNCGGFATKDVYVQELPEMDGPDVVCLNANATYTITGGDTASGVWTLTYPDLSTASGTGGTFTGTFDQVGPYILTVQGNFCSPPMKEIVVKDPPPMPDDILGPDTICKGAPTKYEAINELQGYVFNWKVDNGVANATSGNTSFVTLNMGSTGPFVIKVWRESKDAPYCPSDTLTKTIDTPVVIFDIDGADTVCPSTYENYSVDYEDGETYFWYIDDQLLGSVMDGQGTKDIEVLWNNAPGTALLICEIRKCYGNYYRDTFEVYIRPQATVSITGPSGVCSGVGFQLTVSGNGSSVDWNMGDGNEANSGSTVWHTYTIGNVAPKTMKVTAVVNNPNGCEGKAVATKSITVNPGPAGRIASTGPGRYYCDSNVYETLSVLLYNGSPTITGYQWYRNGSPIGTGSTVNVNQFGNYTVKLTGSNGCEYTTGIYNILYECQDTCELSFEPTLSIDSIGLDSCGYVYAKASYSASGFWTSNWSTNGGGTVTWSDDDEAYFSYDTAATYEITFRAWYIDGEDTCEFKVSKYFSVPYMSEVSVDFLCTTSGAPGTRDVVINFNGTQTGPITYFQFKVDGTILLCSGSNNSCTTTVTSGTNHIFELKITDGVHDSCWSMLDLFIDPLPIADFGFWRPDTTCAKQAFVDFTNNSVATPDYLSFWEFGDGAENTDRDPERVYENPGPYDVTLTITDKFGCTDDTTKGVYIIDMTQDGFIQPFPSSPCKGQPVTLTYNSNTLFMPDNYFWMDDEVNFASGTFNPITVFESGYYWVRGTDKYGCYVETIADSVHIVEVPPAFVSGDTAQCVDVPFILSGYAGSDPNIQYSWLLNGSILSLETSPILKQVQSGSGIYDYRVIVTVPNPGGGFCSDTSLPFLVYVRSLPTPPGIQYSIVNCNDYAVQLNANPALIYGTYNWSTGASGTTIFVKSGGNFQLTYTDTFGCVSKSTEDVPKDPRVYLWIFPTGCFTICPPEVLTVTGPIIKFNEWRYLRNGGIDFSGTNSIPLDYTIWREGVYNLYLDNGWCNVTSGNMLVDTNCSGGTGGGGEGKPGRNASVMQLNSGDVAMSLAPNPARDAVTIQYTFNNTGNDRRIEIYDLTGRLVAAHQAPSAEGNWTLKLDMLTSGIYNAVLREDGNVLLYGKLSVVK